MPTWRLLDSGCADGAKNMAVDEALLEAFIAGDGSPTLRFFQWSPPCVSVGYFQSLAGEVDLERCRELGIHWVRRITGGRLILHQHELTYSVVASENDPLVSGGILESYRKISLALHAGLARLGVAAHLADPDDSTVAAAPGLKRGVCFNAAAGHELVVEGKKMVGSAQVRRKGVILQHGSILIDIDAALHQQIVRSVSGLSPEQCARVFYSHVLTLGKSLGRTPSHDEIVAAVVQGFQETWGVAFERRGLNAVEMTLASELRHKYASDAWNLNR
jgi:lipoate-protein ligase A